MQGITVKASFSRGSQSFYFPVLLSRKLDLRLLAASYIVPPIAYYLLTRHVIRPLHARHRLQKVPSLCFCACMVLCAAAKHLHHHRISRRPRLLQCDAWLLDI